jgi:hypothetical protein
MIMNRKFSIAAVFAVLIAFAVFVLAQGTALNASPAPAPSKKIVKTEIVAPTQSKAITNEDLAAKVTGTKPPLEELSQFAFKIEQRVKPLAGYTEAVDHVPVLINRSSRPPR